MRLCMGEECGYLCQDITRTMLKAACLTVIAERGVRVVADYLSPRGFLE